MNSNLQNLAENAHVPASATEHVRRMTGGERNSPMATKSSHGMSATMCVAVTAGGKKTRDRKHGKAFVAS